MRLFKYLGQHLGAVLIVFVLLIAQAFCDLMLPSFTAQIVDVGIQQAGVEHVAVDEMRESTYDAISSMLAGEDARAFEAAYECSDTGTYRLTDEGRATRDTLDRIIAYPLVVSANADLLAAHVGAEGGTDVVTVSGIDRREALDALGITEDLLEQAALSAARAEYAELGYDLGAMQMNYLLITGLKMMGFVALSVLIAAFVGLVASRTGATIGRDLRSKMFSKVMSFSDAEVQRFSAASLITRATNDIQQIQMMTIMLLRMVLYAPILAVGGIIMVARTNLSMGWIIGVAIAAIVVVVLTLMLIVMPKFKIMQKLVDKVNLVSRERLTGVSVVRAFGRQEGEQQRFDDASLALMRTQLFTNRAMTFMMPAMMMIMNLVSVAIVWLGADAIDAGTIQTGDLIAFITYSMVIIMGFLMLSMLAIIAPRADVSAQRIDEVLEADVSIADPAPADAQAPAQGGSGAEIAFDHVSFAYDEGSEPVLNDVTFTADAGKTCAIIGSTGSGKSSILKLVERFYDVTDGAVRVDGVDVRDMSLEDLRSQFGYVPQKSFLFSGTIESNVAYGEDEVDEARIREALEIAQVADFVDAQDEGLGAEITQGGTNVSGGQRQRLAIARALATDARALLFDDSFSALDYKTDAALRRALSERLPGKTQIVVAQRIATVLHADKIVVLDEGRVVGIGTHDELLHSCAQYREIAYSQLSPEELEGVIPDERA